MTTEREYVVHIKGGEAGDIAYVQPNRAVSGEVADDYLVFHYADGSLAGLFLMFAVDSWREVPASEANI